MDITLYVLLGMRIILKVCIGIAVAGFWFCPHSVVRRLCHSIRHGVTVDKGVPTGLTDITIGGSVAIGTDVG